MSFVPFIVCSICFVVVAVIWLCAFTLSSIADEELTAWDTASLDA